jgi:two-component system, OmpR family, response regulator ArlR
MKILLICDKKDVASFVIKAFARKKVKIDTAEFGNVIMGKIARWDCDVVIIDQAFGGGGGIMTAKEIGVLSNAPMLMLIDSGPNNDFIRAFDAGVDDCLQKPFDGKELFVRVEKLADRKRLANFKGLSVWFGGLSLNVKTHVVMLDKERIVLTKAEYQILKSLMLRRDTVVEGRIIEASFARKRPVSTQLINTHITNLRKKLNPDFKIINVPGKGYILEKSD